MRQKEQKGEGLRPPQFWGAVCPQVDAALQAECYQVSQRTMSGHLGGTEQGRRGGSSP